MTASDHLKQRLATGSLGGDQDEKAVEELIAELEKWPPFVAEKNEALKEIAEINRLFARKMMEQGMELQAMEAALAQKTRECEELKDKMRFHEINRDEREQHCVELNIPPADCCKPKYCAIAPYKEVERLRAQVEQLGRQVAEISRPYSDEEIMDALSGQPLTPLIRTIWKDGIDIEEPSTLARNFAGKLITSRARTK